MLIKEHDDYSGIDNILDTIKQAILVARAPEPLRNHLQVNSQSYTTFLEMRQAINQYLKARKGFKLMERDDPTDVDFVHKEGQKGKGEGNDKGKGKPKGKSKGKDKQNEKGKSVGKGKSNQEKFQGTCGNCGKTGHKWSECWAKGGGAANQANNVGETEKTGDVNWIMMVQNLSVGQLSTSESETWRCSGTSVSCKSAHESQVFIHAESDRVVPNSNVTLHVAESFSTQQSTVDHTHQPDIRPESANPVNPVILSNIAKVVVGSGCFDNCCPLEFATQFELKEGRFLNASAANTIKLKHYGTRVVEGWTRDVNGTEIPLTIKFNVFDVKSSLLSTSKLRKHGYSVLLDQPQTVQKNGTTFALTDQNGLPTLELRLASRAGEVDEKMCALVEEIGEEARRATPMYVPRGALRR